MGKAKRRGIQSIDTGIRLLEALEKGDGPLARRELFQRERPVPLLQRFEQADAGVDRLDAAALGLAHCAIDNALAYGQYCSACYEESSIRVTLKPSGHSYECEQGKSILQAGLDA